VPDSPRPDRITAEDLARWREQALDFLTKHPAYSHRLGTLDRFIERWGSGAWLGVELERLGDSQELAEAGCFALGQIHAAYVLIGRHEPWRAFHRVLDARASGHPIVPGPELAAELISETTGVEFDPGDFPPMPGVR
jgi:hypothetical protein